MRYAIHGLVVESPWELAEVPASDAQADIQVTVAGRGSEHPPQKPRRSPSRWDVLQDDFRAVVRDGSVIEVFSEVDDETAPIYLMGSCMGAVLLQRGFLPLHANAVSVRGSAVLLAGDQGAGKSTLAAALRAVGHVVITDDLCCLEEGQGEFRVRAGYQRLRLWGDSLALLGMSSHGLSRIRPELDKYLVVLNEPVPPPGVVSRVYILERDEECELHQLQGIAKLEALDRHVYRGQIENRNRNFPHLLPQLLQLARSTAVKTLSRGPTTTLPELVHRIEEDCS